MGCQTEFSLISRVIATSGTEPALDLVDDDDYLCTICTE